MSNDPLSFAVTAAGGPNDPAGERTLEWLAASADPTSPDTQLFAKLLAARDVRREFALLGLREAEWNGLMARRFERSATKAPAPAVTTGEHAAFVESLRALLLAYAARTVDADDARCLASIVAHACLRPDHLWRDLGLTGREDVTWMLTRYFPTLVVLNVANLRWKKFLAQQRALSLGLQPGPAPGCPGCEDYAHCFPASP
ncbi:nitrogen fixation protein NifQ [Paraburkholderia xenovorans]|uniref:nitrogen fixation protein NifQ n=1 Tax=Paraburkholderia xenovorans TaxID=36873 RepID=UPI0038BD3E34